MTAGITKRPADWLEPVARGVVYVVLGSVFAVGAALLASAGRPATQPAPVAVVNVWEATGSGDDVTGAFDSDGGAYLIGWEAPCAVTVAMIPWNDEDAGTPIPLGTGAHVAAKRNLDEGGYFFDVVGDCAWKVRVSPT